MSVGTDPCILPRPPAALLGGASLFIDFDGTLVEIVDRPDAVFADEFLRSLLAALHDVLQGRIAVISGRSLAQLDAMLGPVAQVIALSGSHGNELRWDGKSMQPLRPAALDAASDALHVFAARHPGTIVEVKSYSIALHYRQAPEIEASAQAVAAQLADELGLHLERGKMVAELRVGGNDKGFAVRKLMEHPRMSGSRPLFIGDDLTDEAGFEAARELGGAGILVGERLPTAADYALPDVAAVRDWLASALS